MVFLKWIRCLQFLSMREKGEGKTDKTASPYFKQTKTLLTMQKYFDILKMAVILTVILWGCSPRSFVGEITAVNSDTACLSKNCFLLLKNAPKAYKGQKATFTPTLRKSKVNCIRIK